MMEEDNQTSVDQLSKQLIDIFVNKCEHVTQWDERSENRKSIWRENGKVVK